MMEGIMADIALQQVSKSFGDTQAVKGISLDIHDGEFVVLLGPTGAGKTTTLRLVAGLEKADSGNVMIGGERVNDLPPSARDTAFVFQQYSLYPHLTVYENLAFPLQSPARRLDKPAIDRRVREVAAMVRIGHKLENKATRLSGGEMQRVAIARALANRPGLLLADEPTGELDQATGEQIVQLLDRLHADGTAVVVVTHDPAVAARAHRLLRMRDGRIVDESRQ
jgi:multiple sugar transport system ATP-binding protein